MGFPGLGAARYTETARECTLSLLYDVRHARYVVPPSRPLDSRCLECGLPPACHGALRGSSISRNTNQMAVGKLKTIKLVLQIYG